MYEEVECNEGDGYQQKQAADSTMKNTTGQLQMFEKGKKKRKQPVEEDSSDEEGGEQLVCNMNGSNWE